MSVARVVAVMCLAGCLPRPQPAPVTAPPPPQTAMAPQPTAPQAPVPQHSRDGGTIAGAVNAPSLDWSPRRARVVMAGTIIGAFAGGMMAGLIAKPNEGSRPRRTATSWPPR